MSCNNWENGAIKFASAEWSPFKKKLQEGASKLLEADFAMALKLHASLEAQKKGQRGFDLKKAFSNECEQTVKGPRRSAYGGGYEDQPKYVFQMKEYCDIARLLLSEDGETLRKPLKKDFPKFTTASYHFEVDGGQASISLDNEARTAVWNVSENNHAVENAHESAMGKLFFKALDAIVWTRNTGGVLVGNDETERYSRAEGGGANYVTYRYGPLGTKDNLDRLAKHNASAKKASTQATRGRPGNRSKAVTF